MCIAKQFLILSLLLATSLTSAFGCEEELDASFRELKSTRQYLEGHIRELSMSDKPQVAGSEEQVKYFTQDLSELNNKFYNLVKCTIGERRLHLPAYEAIEIVNEEVKVSELKMKEKFHPKNPSKKTFGIAKNAYKAMGEMDGIIKVIQTAKSRQ